MKLYLITLALLINLLTLPSVSATSLLPVGLQQLSTRATLIFYAEVTNNTVSKDEKSGRIATFTEFKIIDLIKGDAGSTHTIKQIGGHLASSATTLRVHGVPEFQPGSSYVVFLPERSTLGFSSPLGLHQGSFTVSIVDGEKIISNGRKLTEQQAQVSDDIQLPLAVQADKPTHARLDDFINTVRAYNTH